MVKEVDTRHIVDQGRRVADVRPWSVKTQEKLSDPGNFLFFMVIVVGGAIAMPIILPVAIVVYLIAHFSVMSMKSILPYRYPAHKGIDPETSKPAKGIAYVGYVRSESPFEKFKQCWLSDDDLRKHWLIMGSTGSGKSETLKGIFYNSLCWGSGFFCADGKADNKLPTDGFTMALAFGRDDDVLALNFLLGGKTPQQVARSRRKRSNGLNPFSTGDADTLIQMGANLLPKAEGDGKSWQEKALVVWRAVITALCYKRDNQNFSLSVGTIIDYLSLHMIEELYIEGYKEAQESEDGTWSYGFSSIKNYLEAGCPAYSVEKLLKKHNLSDSPQTPAPGGRRQPPGRDTEQDNAALEQHGYRVSQLMPVLNLLDKTYSHIFRAPFSEIDMIDVALHNRILFLLIPSLEKSSQEAENLGKLAIACLRVMMARNLGAELEGTSEELIESKATQAPYPYVVALDELGYYFADGIAVMFAQARSLGISMLAAAQDLEKLTEGNRQAEAGAMIGNTVNKIFLKIDDPEKTWRLVSSTIGKVNVATYSGYEAGKGAGGYAREKRVGVSEQDMVSFQEMQKYTEGQGVINALGITRRLATFYMGDWLKNLNNTSFHLNRFMQVAPPSNEDLENNSIALPRAGQKKQYTNGRDLLATLRGARELPPLPQDPVYAELMRVTGLLDKQFSGIGPVERGAVLYLALKKMVEGGVSTAIENANEEYGPAPASMVLLGSEQAVGLAEALDEHGLPDPLSLIRKPLSEVLQSVNEEPERKPLAKRAGFSVSDAMMTEEMEHGPAGSYDFDLLDAQADLDPIDDILAQGRPEKKPGTSAAWVNKAIGEAHKMAREPRSANNTVVGLSEKTLHELEGLERELGSSLPKSSAKSMEKIVSAQNTPDTVGRGAVPDDEIESFFTAIMSGALSESITEEKKD